MKRLGKLLFIFIILMLFVGCSNQNIKEVENKVSKYDSEVIWIDSKDSRIVSIFKELYIDHQSKNNEYVLNISDNYFDEFINEMDKLKDENEFAKKIIELLDNGGFSKLSEVDKRLYSIYFVANFLEDSNGVYTDDIGLFERIFYGEEDLIEEWKPYASRYNYLITFNNFPKNKNIKNNSYYCLYVNDDSDGYVEMNFNYYTKVNSEQFIDLKVYDEYIGKTNLKLYDISNINNFIKNDKLINFVVEYRNNVYSDIRSNEVKLEQEKIEKQKEIEEEKKRKAEQEPKVGMSKDDVLAGKWGEPSKKNITDTKYGTHEQWIYSGNRYIYFDDGVVTSIQRSE